MKSIGFCSDARFTVLLLFLTRLHLHRESRTEAKGLFEDGCFGKAYVLIPAVVELFEDLFLLVCEGLLQVRVMPCPVSEQLFHLL